MKKLGFGIIGPGKIAHKFAQAIQITDNAFLAGVASKSIDRAKAFAEEYSIPAYYDSYDEMCKNRDIDVVYISTTNNYHYDNILTCITNKKHVVCEKPIVMTQSQAEDIFARAKENGIFVMEALWSRFLPSIQKAKELIDTGVIGEIKHITSSFNLLIPYDPNRRIFNRFLGGGVLYDLGVYCISLSLFFVNEEPLSYTGFFNMCSEGTDIDDTVIMKFPSGATASFICSTETDSPNDMIIYGSKGCIKLCKSFLGCKRVELFDKKDVIQTFDFEFDNGFVYQIAEAIRCINSGAEQSEIMPWKDSLACISMIDKLLNSRK